MMKISGDALVNELIDELGRRVGDVRADYVTRLLYSTDASNYQIMPVGVAFPRADDEVCAIMETARAFGVPVLPRGGGSSLAGQSVGSGLVIDFSRYMNAPARINPESRRADCSPGATLLSVNTAAKPHGLAFGPDPASAERATVGGTLANNATGAHSIVYGLSIDHTVAVDAVLSDGSRATFQDEDFGKIDALSKRPGLEGALYTGIARILKEYEDDIAEGYPKVWRTVAGYPLDHLAETVREHGTINLGHLLVGSEGTLAAIIGARLNLVQKPALTRLEIVHYDDIRAALESVPAVLETGPSSAELTDRTVLDGTIGNPIFEALTEKFQRGQPQALLAVEYQGDSEAELQAKADALARKLEGWPARGPIVSLHSEADQNAFWSVRKSGLGLINSRRGPRKPLAFIEDASVPPEHLADYVDEVRRIVGEYDEGMAIYAHASAGCLHIRPRLDLRRPEHLRAYREIGEGALKAAIRYGGTTSGEHGEGLARGEFSDDLFGPRLTQAFREVKALWDPDGIMNPGKVVDVGPMDDPDTLRFNPAYATPYDPDRAATRLDFARDGGFAGAVEMCNGAGVCRKLEEGVMCPSFKATQEESASTRARANILRAALQGKLGPEALADPRVKEVLDLCLQCKACKTECPSRVDMARLKTAVNAMNNDAHGTPIRSWMFGHIADLNALGSIWPAFTNFVLKNPVTRAVMGAVGIAKERQFPLLAPQTFRQWFYSRPKTHIENSRGTVVFFDDTYLLYNTPRIGTSAVKVLEAAGYEIKLVNKVCCGRPAISKGLLDDARAAARHNVHVLAPFVRKGIPVVGCEPSCMAALRDEYADLVKSGERADARLLANNTFTIEEFMAQVIEEVDLPWDEKPRDVYFHGHCYQKALWGTKPAVKLLSAIPNATVHEMDTGCCGVAGAFGFEAEHYAVSMAVGELSLLPQVREAPETALVAAAGTSCREQIDHGAGREAVHPIVIVADALSSS